MPATKRKKASASPKRSFDERKGKYMTLAEVADYFGVTVRKVQRMIGNGELRATKIGKLVRVHQDDLAAAEARMRAKGRR